MKSPATPSPGPHPPGACTTLGVDLAAHPKGTVYCLIEWGTPHAQMRELRCHVDDARLLAVFGRADKIGIAAPFGWPTAFADTVFAQQQNGWPTGDPATLRYRTTDHSVYARTNRWPESVSLDTRGTRAIRAARLLAENGPIDRSGRGRFVEVYPAAALHIWGFRSPRYKDQFSAGRRRLLARRLVAATHPWLAWPQAAQLACERSHDALVAVVAALVARAAATGQIEPIPPEHLTAATQEGWTALPRAGSLTRLAADR